MFVIISSVNSLQDNLVKILLNSKQTKFILCTYKQLSLTEKQNIEIFRDYSNENLLNIN